MVCENAPHAGEVAEAVPAHRAPRRVNPREHVRAHEHLEPRERDVRLGQQGRVPARETRGHGVVLPELRAVSLRQPEPIGTHELPRDEVEDVSFGQDGQQAMVRRRIRDNGGREAICADASLPADSAVPDGDRDGLCERPCAAEVHSVIC